MRYLGIEKYGLICYNKGQDKLTKRKGTMASLLGKEAPLARFFNRAGELCFLEKGA